MSQLLKELDNFMIWLKKTHPEIHDKYEGNFTIPFQVGGGVGVNTNNRISKDEHDMLMKIAHSYYELPDK